jgi:hypothetical protein
VPVRDTQSLVYNTATPNPHDLNSARCLFIFAGGTALFDEKAVELNAENILIVDGGVLQIGTKENPHLYPATITLHGNLRATELPIYGAKCLAVRNGTLDLHGKPDQLLSLILGQLSSVCHRSHIDRDNLY